MVAESAGLFISGSAFGSLCGVVIAWIKAKYGQKVKAEVPQPFKVSEQQDCVSIKECNRRMKDFDERLGKLERRFAVGFDNILAKLDAMDRKSEDRAIACNRRLDPIVEKTSEIAGKVELIERKVFKIS